MEKKKWAIIKYLSLIPFLFFVPGTVFTFKLSFAFFIGFFVYLIVWLIAASIIERIYFSKGWIKRTAAYFGIIIAVQVILSVISLMVYDCGYTPTKPKMKLQKPKTKQAEPAHRPYFDNALFCRQRHSQSGS
jgi:cytochrome c oxidase subunit IV